MLNTIARIGAAIIIYCCLIQASSVLVNEQNPVKWDFSSSLSGKEYQLVFKATISKGWHIYSQNMNGDGPVPTSITITKSKHFSLVGKTEEPQPFEKYDPNFDMKVKWFDNEVKFTQKIKPLVKTDFKVEGFVTFMTCDDTKCLPPVDVPFSISIKQTAAKVSTTQTK